MATPSNLLIRFGVQRTLNEYKSEQEGRPIYDEDEVVAIRVIGSRDEVSHIVTDEIRREYREQYSKWKAGHEAPVSGTPLEEWPKASSSFIDEMRLYGVRTVEELSALSDGIVSSNPGWMTMRTQAQAWLEAAGDSAAVTRYASENEALKAQLAAMQEQINRMGTAQANVPASKRKGAVAPAEMSEAELDAMTDPT